MWHVKLEREGILDKAKAFEIEVPPLVNEGALLEDEETASMAFYARVFALKVAFSCHAARTVPLRVTHASHSPPLESAPATTVAAQGYKMRDETYESMRDRNPIQGTRPSPDHDGGIRTAVRTWFEDPAPSRHGMSRN